jgi:hypothetical protein
VAEGIAAPGRVRREFSSRGMAYDAALAPLAREVARFLHRARHNPELRLAGPLTAGS